MKITKISVTGLFGQYDHTIPLNQDERITIIHGPNGVGKTILLRMIHGLFQANFGPFRDVPLQEFRVELDDARHLAVVPGPQPKGSLDLADEGSPGILRFGKPSITVTSDDVTQEYISHEYADSDPALPSARDEIDRCLPELRLYGRSQWYSSSIGETLTLEDVCERFAPRLEHRLLRKPPEWLAEILSQAPTIMLRTDRLEVATTRLAPGLEAGSLPKWMTMGSAPLRYCSDQLVTAIEQAWRSADAEARGLDQVFPGRLIELLEEAEVTAPSIEVLRSDWERLAARRMRLVEIGIEQDESEEQILDYTSINETTRTVLALYLEHSRKKLDVYEPLLTKMELMSRIINSRLAASSKSLVMGVPDGFVVNTPNGKSIALEDLSSGEKQQFLLFYHLIFSTKRGTLVLIDEPELSMHIAWQQKFLKDVAAVAKLNDLQFLIATHSPDIIYDRWDLTVELKGKGPDEEEH